MHEDHRDSSVLIVDGYNILLTLAEREGARMEESQLFEAQRQLIEVLDEWASARGIQAVIAWDGRATAPDRPRSRTNVRVVFVDPPAEADDWIVGEAARLARENHTFLVATLDQGLLARLPKASRRLELKQLAADLHAILSRPLRAPHVHGPDDLDFLPVSSEPVDTSRLPRRRQPKRDFTNRDPVPNPTRPVAPPPRPAAPLAPESSSASELERQARAAAAERKEARRKRFEKKQRRGR